MEVLRPTVTPVVSAAVLKGLAKVPADRYATAAEFRQALRAEKPVTVPSSAGQRRSGRRLRFWGVAAALAVAAAAITYFWPPAVTLDPRRVVVFPLAATIPGVDEATLGWEAALAIEAALVHTEPLRWFDGRAHLPMDVRAAPRLLTPEVARAVTRRLGARYYLTGVIRGDLTEPAVTLWLHDAAGDSVVQPATQAGVGTTVALLAIRAVEPLLVSLIEPGRTVDLSPLTQRAQGAIALMLQGDVAYRQARFLEALDFYKRAIALDSMMALAAVKGAQAANWAALTEPEAWPLLDHASAAIRSCHRATEHSLVACARTSAARPTRR